MYKHLEDHTVQTRSTKVFWAIKNSANRIDKDITRAMIHAEKTCRQPDRPAWSETLHLASKAVRFWKTFISGARNWIDVSEALSTIAAVLGWDSIPTILLKEAKTELAKAQQDLKECRSHAAKNRQKILSKLVEAAALKNDISKEKALKQQLHVEAMKSCYRNFTRHLDQMAYVEVSRWLK
jgi:hypothetical protein